MQVVELKLIYIYIYISATLIIRCHINNILKLLKLKIIKFITVDETQIFMNQNFIKNYRQSRTYRKIPFCTFLNYLMRGSQHFLKTAYTARFIIVIIINVKI